MNDDPGVSTRRVLVCEVGTMLCALPLEHVAETMRLLPVDRLEHAPTFVRGIAMVRGEPTVVIDAALLLGLDAEAPTRLVVLRVGERRTAVAVTAVVGTRDVAAASLRDMPPMLQEATPESTAVLGRLDGELLVLLRGVHVAAAAADLAEVQA